MITTRKNSEAPVEHFPKLMISDMGTVVLFTEEDMGTVVHKGDGNMRVGEFSETWYADAFEDFKGIVELKNK